MEEDIVTMTLIGYSDGSSCDKAKAWLNAHGTPFVSRDIQTQNPTYNELKEWQAKSGLPLKKFFNTASVLYRTMSLGDRMGMLSEEAQFNLLATDGMLVKTPILVGDDFVLVGFKQEAWEEALQ